MLILLLLSHQAAIVTATVEQCNRVHAVVVNIEDPTLQAPSNFPVLKVRLCSWEKDLIMG